jgi:hypothetical protein
MRRLCLARQAVEDEPEPRLKLDVVLRAKVIGQVARPRKVNLVQLREL